MFDFEMPEHRFRAHVIASLERIERALGVEDKALTTIMKLEIKNMETLDQVLVAATALSSLEDSVKMVMDGSNAHIADLEKQLADEKAQPAIDQTKVDAIAAQLVKVTAVAQAMAAVAANTPAAPAPAVAPAAPAAAPHA